MGEGSSERLLTPRQPNCSNRNQESVVLSAVVDRLCWPAAFFRQSFRPSMAKMDETVQSFFSAGE